MKGGLLSDKTKKYAAGVSNMRAIPKVAAVLGTSAVGALATKKAIDLDKKIKDKKKTMARIRSNLRKGDDSHPVIGVFDMVVSKMHHLVDQEHVNFDTFFNNTVQGQGHQMFPFNIFAFIARKSPDQMRKILNKSFLLQSALKYGVNKGLTAAHLSTKESYSEWCEGLKEELDQGELTEEQKTQQQIDIQILKGLSTMSDELSGWAFHYLSHFNNLGVAIPAFLHTEMDELKKYFSDVDFGHPQIHEIDIFLQDMESKVEGELKEKITEFRGKLHGCKDKYQLIFCFIFVIMIKDFPTYTGDGYDMKDARNNMVFRSINTVMRALRSDVQSSKEFIFVHVVKDLFKPGKDGKQLIDEVDHPLKETLKAIHEKELPQLQKLQQLQQLYETKKETCHSLISEYLTLKETKMGEDIVDVMTDTLDAFEQVAKEINILTQLDDEED